MIAIWPAAAINPLKWTELEVLRSTYRQIQPTISCLWRTAIEMLRNLHEDEPSPAPPAT